MYSLWENRDLPCSAPVWGRGARFWAGSIWGLRRVVLRLGTCLERGLWSVSIFVSRDRAYGLGLSFLPLIWRYSNSLGPANPEPTRSSWRSSLFPLRRLFHAPPPVYDRIVALSFFTHTHSFPTSSLSNRYYNGFKSITIGTIPHSTTAWQCHPASFRTLHRNIPHPPPAVPCMVDAATQYSPPAGFVFQKSIRTQTDLESLPAEAPNRQGHADTIHMQKNLWLSFPSKMPARPHWSVNLWGMLEYEEAPHPARGSFGSLKWSKGVVCIARGRRYNMNSMAKPYAEREREIELPPVDQPPPVGEWQKKL